MTAENKSTEQLLCKHCGKSFTITDKRTYLQLFCSKDCRLAFYSEQQKLERKLKPPPQTKICAHCQKAFIPRKNRQTAQRFCSSDCRHAHYLAEKEKGKQEEPKPITCLFCKKTFTPNIKNNAWRTQKFCSQRCGRHYHYHVIVKGQKEPPTPPQGRTCKVCGKTFMPKKQKSICCSEECRKKFYSPFREPEPITCKRKCHDCGKPTTNYRCPLCLAKWKRKHGVSISDYNNANHEDEVFCL